MNNENSNDVLNQRKIIFAIILFGNFCVAVVNFVLWRSLAQTVENAFLMEEQHGALASSWTVEARPIEVAVAMPVKLSSIVGHLKSIGYVDTSRKDATCSAASVDQPRSFCQSANNLFVNSGKTNIYPAIQIRLDAGRKRVASIVEVKSSSIVERAEIEPSQMVELKPFTENGKLKTTQSTNVPIKLGKDIKTTDLFIKFLLWKEDRAFYFHNGLSYPSILRAAKENIFGSPSGQTQGGSTITAQVCKQIFSDGKPRDVWTKIEEFYCAAAMEVYLTAKLGSKQKAKDKILDLYINLVPLHIERPDLQRKNRIPEIVVGFGTASKLFFNRRLSELDLLESAAILISVPSPDRISKQSELTELRDSAIREFVAENPEYTSNLKNSVDKTVEFRFGSDGDLKSDDAVSQKLKNDLRKAGYFTSANKDRSVNVTTTIDWQMQAILSKTIESELKKFRATLEKSINKKSAFDTQADFLVVDSNKGEVLNFLSLKAIGKETFANLSSYEDPLKPGSSIKPLFVTKMIDRGFWTMNSSINPSQCRSRDGWRPDDAADFPNSDSVQNWLISSNNPFMNCACDALTPDEGLKTLNDLFYRDEKMIERINKERASSGNEHRCRMFWGLSADSLTSIFDLAGAYTSFPSGVRKPVVFIKKIFVNGVQQEISVAENRIVFKPEASSVVAETLRSVARRKLGSGFAGALMAKTGSTTFSYVIVVASSTTVFLAHLKMIPKNNDFDKSSVELIFAGDVAVPMMTQALVQISQNRPHWIAGDFKNERVLSFRIKEGCISNDGQGELTSFISGSEPPVCEPPIEQTDFSDDQ